LDGGGGCRIPQGCRGLRAGLMSPSGSEDPLDTNAWSALISSDSPAPERLLQRSILDQSGGNCPAFARKAPGVLRDPLHPASLVGFLLPSAEPSRDLFGRIYSAASRVKRLDYRGSSQDTIDGQPARGFEQCRRPKRGIAVVGFVSIADEWDRSASFSYSSPRPAEE
jgi:hypothetical protein